MPSLEALMVEVNNSIDLSIITVSWNVQEFLRECLKSISVNRGDLNLEVIVVDSASSDDTPEMVRCDFPWVKLICLDENVGFPRGNNLGIRSSHGRNVLLLNPDTVVQNNALETMVKYLDKHIDVGGMGAQLLNTDGSIQSSRRRFPTILTALFEGTWLDAIAPKHVQQQYFALDLPNDQIVDVDWVTGACLMVPRRVIDVVGLMDEGFFMYSEELDWCRRIKDAGWRIIYNPQAQIIHHIGKSSEQAVTARHINFQRAKLRYYRKFHGRPFASFLRFFLLSIYIWQIFVEGSKGLVGSKRALRWQRVNSYYQVIRSGLRPSGY